MEMEHDLRLREVQVNVEQDGGGEGGVPRSNRGHPVAMKALKLPLFNDEKDDLDAYLIRFERACTALEIRPDHSAGKTATGKVPGCLSKVASRRGR